MALRRHARAWSLFSLALVATLLAAPFAAPPAAGAEPAAAFRDCADCPEMVRIPAGSFVMGTPGADPRDPATRAESQALIVRIGKPFALGRVEITRREYRAFMGDTDYESRGGCRSWDGALGRFNEDRTRGWQNPGVPRQLRDDHPVSCVSWTDAKAYVQWLAHKTGKQYRLPSEAEWEYAARAGSSTLRPWGEAAADGCDFANIHDLASSEQYTFGWAAARCRDGFADVAPVGSLRANAFGLYDMIGNVWEWVEDCETDSYLGRPRDGRAWVWVGGCVRHVQRGGGWLSPPEQARSAFRGGGDAGERADYLGFRVALDLDGRAEGH